VPDAIRLFLRLLARHLMPDILSIVPDAIRLFLRLLARHLMPDILSIVPDAIRRPLGVPNGR